jgi:hypothetical protein
MKKSEEQIDTIDCTNDIDNKKKSENNVKEVIKLDNEDKKNIKIIIDKYNIDEITATELYIAFNKNIITSLNYISNEISNINIIHNQTGLDLEESRNLYYSNNKDTIDAISNYFDNKHLDTNTEKTIKKTPLYDSNNNYKHIIDCGVDYLYDEDSGNLFDLKTKEFSKTIKTVSQKIEELRSIVDDKDNIIESQKKSLKKEKINEVILNYQEKLREWGEKEINKWDSKSNINNNFKNKQEYIENIENQIKIKFAEELNKF